MNCFSINISRHWTGGFDALESQIQTHLPTIKTLPSALPPRVLFRIWRRVLGSRLWVSTTLSEQRPVGISEARKGASYQLSFLFYPPTWSRETHPMEQKARHEQVLVWQWHAGSAHAPGLPQFGDWDPIFSHPLPFPHTGKTKSCGHPQSLQIPPPQYKSDSRSCAAIKPQDEGTDCRDSCSPNLFFKQSHTGSTLPRPLGQENRQATEKEPSEAIHHLTEHEARARRGKEKIPCGLWPQGDY